MALISDWLNNRIDNSENGIIFDNHDANSFNLIQNFIEGCDHTLKTPVIYYQAFPEESAIEFLDTLREELAGKLGSREPKSQQSLSSIIQDAQLQMVIIDRCHLHPQNTLQNLIDFFFTYNVAVILVGDRDKMAIAQILSNPKVLNWDRLETHDQCKSATKSCQIY